MSFLQRLARVGLPVFYVLMTVIGIRLVWNDAPTVETVAQGFTVAGQALFALLAMAAFVARILRPRIAFRFAVGWAVALTLTAAAAPVTFGDGGAEAAIAGAFIGGVVAAGALWVHHRSDQEPPGDLAP